MRRSAISFEGQDDQRFSQPVITDRQMFSPIVINLETIKRVAALDAHDPQQKYNLFFQLLNHYVLAQNNDNAKTEAFFMLCFALYKSRESSPAIHFVRTDSHAQIFTNIVRAIVADERPLPSKDLRDLINQRIKNKIVRMHPELTEWFSRLIAVSAAAELYRDGGRLTGGSDSEEIEKPASGEGKHRVNNFLSFLAQITSKSVEYLPTQSFYSDQLWLPSNPFDQAKKMFWSLIKALFDSSSTSLKQVVTEAICWPEGCRNDHSKTTYIKGKLGPSSLAFSSFASHIVNPEESKVPEITEFFPYSRSQRTGLSVKHSISSFDGFFDRADLKLSCDEEASAEELKVMKIQL